jgi:maleate isomerase
MTTRIGLVVPCDLTLDREYWDLAPDDVSIHVTRTGFHDGGLDLAFVRGVSDLGELAYATKSLSKIEPAVIGYACTSGSFIHGLAGEATIRETMLANGAEAAVTTSGSMLDALRHLGVRRVGLGTPYALEIAEFLPPFVRDAGFEPVSLANLELPDVVGEIAADAVRELAALAYRPDADAVFLACTGVPTIGLLAELTQQLGVPVLSANQVTMWAALRAAGLPDAIRLHRPEAVVSA